MKRAIFLLALLSGCSGRQSALDPVGEQAGHLLGLLEIMLWICGLAYALVLIGLGWAIVRARRRVEPAGHGDGPIGRMLWAWAGFIVVGLAILASASFMADRAMAARENEAALEVRVTGHQWWWRIEYRDPASGGWIETANELHLPAGRTTRVLLASADVIHSFWVPNVSGKMDLIPGRTNAIAVTPHRLGWFRGQCAEFCGTQHAQMAFDVKVESADAFAAWLEAQRNPAAASGDALGMQVVTQGPCASCHRVRGTGANGRAGPDLTHLASRRSLAAGVMPMSRGAIQGWIVQPRALKPGTMMPPIPLSAEQADAASRYLASLR